MRRGYRVLVGRKRHEGNQRFTALTAGESLKLHARRRWRRGAHIPSKEDRSKNMELQISYHIPSHPLTTLPLYKTLPPLHSSLHVTIYRRTAKRKREIIMSYYNQQQPPVPPMGMAVPPPQGETLPAGPFIYSSLLVSFHT